MKTKFIFKIILLFCILSNTVFAESLYYKQYIDQDKSLNVYNWGEYLSDGSNSSIAVNKEFEKLTGIKINYSTSKVV